MNAKQRYISGLEKLAFAEAQVFATMHNVGIIGFHLLFSCDALMFLQWPFKGW